MKKIIELLITSVFVIIVFPIVALLITLFIAYCFFTGQAPFDVT